MKLKKIDLSGAKDFLFQKGERIGLAVCGALALIFLGIGLMKAGGSNVDYAQKLKVNTGQREAGIRGPIVVRIVPKPEIKPVWDNAEPDYKQVSWVAVTEGPDSKRQNPLILQAMNDDNHLQMDYIRGGFFCYEPLPGEKVWAIDGAGPAAFQGGRQPGRSAMANGPRLTKDMKPGRFVVVSAVFPMKAQLEEYAQKLRYASVAELMANPQDLPQAVGLNVFRYEIKADGKATDLVPLYQFDGKDKFEVAKHLEDLYRECYIDEDNPKTLGEQLKPGMITPLPLLANQEYPKLRLKGIKLEELDGPNAPKLPRGVNQPPNAPRVINPIIQNKNPMNPGKEEPEAKFVKVKFSELPPELKDKFTGNIGYFVPSGIKVDDQADPANPQPVRPVPPPGRFIRDPNKKGPPVAPVAQLFDAVVRFIDSNVEPGKTYAYYFQVRMANPNFEKKDVQHQGLAEIKELLSPYTTTPPIFIPHEYFYYAMPSDLQPSSVIPDGSDKLHTKPNASELYTAYGNWTTTVQIHKWLGNFSNLQVERKPVADWAIAERLLTRRGDTIGRPEVMTQVPVWNKGKETFEIQFVPPAKKGSRAGTGLPIDYVWGNPPLLLADFDGGQKWNVRVGTVRIGWDESATDVLVLTPGGKLVARNSRADFDPETPVSNDRENRVEAWQKRLRDVRGGGANGMINGK